MGYVKDIAKVTSHAINNMAYGAGTKAIIKGTAAGLERSSANMFGHTVAGAVKYGIYGAAIGNIAGGVNGLIDQDRTYIGGSIAGSGLGTVAGAGAGVVAAAIAKGLR